MRLLPLVLALLLAGCAAPTAPVAPDGADGDTADDAASGDAGPVDLGPCVVPPGLDDPLSALRAVMEDVPRLDIGLTMTLVQGGERTTMSVAVHRPSERFHLRVDDRGGGYEVQMEGTLYTMTRAGETLLGRNHDPHVLDAVLGSWDGAWFTGLGGWDGTGAGLAPACRAIEGVPVVELGTDAEGVATRFTFERTPPHRPVTFALVDETREVGVDGRFSYGVPEVDVDAAAPRVPATLELVLVEADGEGRTVFEVGPRSAWVPLDELRLHVYDGELQDVGNGSMEAGAHPVAGGMLDYDDRDGDALLSAGDRLALAFEGERTFDLWDLWAEGWAEVLPPDEP